MSIKRMLIVGAVALAPIVAHADADSEREALARITFELDRLSVMVADASKSADTSARIQFHYDWLVKDIEMVRRGVEDHLDAPRQPRPVEPLIGDYRR